MIRRPYLWAAFAITLLAIPVGVSLRARAQKEELRRYAQVPAFSLTDQMGQPISTASLAGKVWVADFVYTSCSMVCPRLTAHMVELSRYLVNRGLGQSMHLVSFTVDPERDTVDRLRGYAKGFQADPNFWSFVTGRSDQIRDAVVNGFKIGIDKEKAEGEQDGFALVHGTRFILVDARGFIRGFYDANDGKDMARLRHDAQGLVEKGGS